MNNKDFETKFDINIKLVKDTSKEHKAHCERYKTMRTITHIELIKKLISQCIIVFLAVGTLYIMFINIP